MSRLADYEGRVLKSVYLYPDKHLLTVINSLQADDFNEPKYRQFFAELDAYSKEHREPSMTSLADFMDDKDVDVELVMNSGSAYIYEPDIKEPIKHIRNRTALAKITNLTDQWKEAASKVSYDAEELVTNIYEDVARVKHFGIDDYDSLSIFKRTEAYLNRIREQGHGWLTGLETVDFLTYGMQVQRLWLIGGYTSVGKSWVGIHLAKQLLKQKVKVLVITMEMSAEDIFIRLASSYLDRPDITIRDIMEKGNETKIAEHKKVMEVLSKMPLYVVDNLYTWEQVSATVRYYVHAFGVQAVFLDYVQNITTNKSSEYEGLNIIVREFQRMSVELNIFTCAFSQINRESARTEDNQVFGFKGSGNLENAADVAMTLRKVDDEHYRQLVIGKNRHGETAEVRLFVNYNYGSISEVPSVEKTVAEVKKYVG